MIYFDSDIGDYYHLKFDKMYYDLLDIKRDSYQPDDIILIKSYTYTENGLWKHFFRIIKFLDIPTFFIHIQTDQNGLAEKVLPVFEDIFPGEDIKIKIVSSRKYNTSHTLCVHPFNSIFIDNKGKYKMCCISKDTLGDADITNTSLEQAQLSEKFSSVREEMLQSKQPSACNSCWINERFSSVSMRTSTDQIFPELTYGTDYENGSPDIRTLDLHTGNVCNLKCRICNPENSSSWAKELKQKNAVNQPSWISDTSSFLWQHLKNKLKTLKYITFHGGEPLLDRKHYVIIDYLLEQNRTDIILHYNTNGTVYPKILLDKLSKFQQVKLSFSIDNTGKKFEYERHGKSWDIVYANLQKFAKLDRRIFTLQFHSTVSIFNILDLEDLVNICHNLNYGPYFNLLNHPAHYSILNIPEARRSKIISKLEKSSNEQVKDFAVYLKNEKQLNLLDDFWSNTLDKDLLRNENFKMTYPEMSAIISNV